MVLAHVPSDTGKLHTITNAFFFVSTLLYFLVGDFLTWKSSSKLSIVSCVVTITGALGAVLFAFIAYVAKKDNAAAVFNYITILALFVKLFLAKKEMVSHGIRITRRLIFNSDDRGE
jgi:uncharacterized YccA/Bax inhibitor family protein